MDTSASLTGCVTVSYTIFYIILRICLQSVHVECFEYVLEFPSLLVSSNSSVQLIVQIQFPFSNVALPRQRSEYYSYGFSFSLFISNSIDKNPVAYSKELYTTLVLLVWLQKQRLFWAFSLQIDPHLLWCTEYTLWRSYFLLLQSFLDGHLTETVCIPLQKRRCFGIVF